MADPADLTQFTLTGTESAVIADRDDAGYNADDYNIWVPVTITPWREVFYLTSTTPPRTTRIRPQDARIETGKLKLPGGVPFDGVRLVAKTNVLEMADDEPLIYSVTYGKGKINGTVVDFSDQNFMFAAPETDTTLDLTTVARVVGPDSHGTFESRGPRAYDITGLHVTGSNQLVFEREDSVNLAAVTVSAVDSSVLPTAAGRALAYALALG